MNTIQKIAFSIIFLHCVFSFKPSDDFCSKVKESCDLSRKLHLHCNGNLVHNGILGKDPRKIPLDNNLKQFILDKHNEFRNIIACSEPQIQNINEESFPKAGKMYKFEWDDELEWAANLNAQTCSNDYDCASTENYIDSGQNIGIYLGSNPVENIKILLSKTIKSFWTPYLITPLSVIDNWSSNLTNLFGVNSKFLKMENLENVNNNVHFTNMILDKSSRIGCSLYDCGKSVYGKHLVTKYLVCNYEYCNVERNPVYKRSKVGGSECSKKSQKYCCLCINPSDSENYSNCFKSNWKFPNPSEFNLNLYKNLSLFISQFKSQADEGSSPAEPGNDKEDLTAEYGDVSKSTKEEMKQCLMHSSRKGDGCTTSLTKIFLLFSLIIIA